ncbi:hypothetical protein H2O64_22525 [Kordia sp. YSTF-M3]|uniref:Carboxypeptidase regulatory-like domain-containing protein n=1 Tax=Kordia aestuariivivens TaxID=2759037 RepID=A0ABR7QGC6_9FLAO|nr:hypothetical protein [Kordia aestuariivivens]MBC8757463.1 hypothetical protein [Kordia aestuariivivens]
MKKKLTKYLLLVTVLLATMIACQKESEPLLENSSDIETTQKEYGANSEHLAQVLSESKGRLTEANFIGRIIDDGNNPIVGATVTLGGHQQTTDQNGIVTFMGASVHENFAYASVTAQGYTNGSRVMVPNSGANSQNTFTIKLFSLGNSQTISSQGGEVTIETDLEREAIIIFNNGFVDENGNSYSGNVSVSANYLDPLSEDTADTMPGDLYGVNANYEEVALGSFGMINVELRGSAGQKLQITSPARIMMPIHPDQMTMAPNQVPMWSFNEDTGVWFEETVAYKNGDYYVTDVNHFSFWNCDAPFPVTNFQATIIDANSGTPLSGVKVTINYNGFVRNALTNNNGIVSGKIPSGQTMNLTISTHICGTVLFTNPTFGPFNGPTSITIPVTVPTQQLINISGTVTNCASQAVTNGYVTYSSTIGQFGGISLVTAGTHNFTGVSCATPVNIDLEAGDMDTGEIATTTVTANPNAVANFNLCGGPAPEYIRYSINGNPVQYEILYPSAGVETPNYLYMSTSAPGNGGTIIIGNVTALGTYPFISNPYVTTTPSLSIKRLGDVNGIDPIATEALAMPMTFTITSFGPVNSYIDVSFTGNYVDSFGTTKTITGEAHLIRDY